MPHADGGGHRGRRAGVADGRLVFYDFRDDHGPGGADHTDGVADFYQMLDVTWEVFAEGFVEPSGLAMSGGVLYVSDHGTGEIVALTTDGARVGEMTTDAAGIMGLAIGPDGALWYVDSEGAEVVRIDP